MFHCFPCFIQFHVEFGAITLNVVIIYSLIDRFIGCIDFDLEI